MKLIVFGATGTIGRHLVNQALEGGHAVTAFARNPAALEFRHDALSLRAGDVLDRSVVTAALATHDAAFICLGAGLSGGVRATGTKHVVEGMAEHGIKRLIGLSTLGAGDSRVHLNFFWKYVMFGLLLRRVLADHEAQESIIQDSRLDWTIVRPAAFTDEPASGHYKHGELTAETDLSLKISRADAAGFMLRQLEDDAYMHGTPAVSN